MNGHACFGCDEFIQTAQQCAAACESDAVFHNVSSQFGRSCFQSLFDGFDDGRYGFAQCFANVYGIDFNGLRQTGKQVTTTDFHFFFLFQRVSGTDGDFDFFRGSVTDSQVKFTFDVVDNGAVQSITGYTQGCAGNDAAQGNDCHFAGTAADVNDHAAGRFRNGQTCADGCSHGFFDEVSVFIFGAGSDGCFQYSSFFYFCYARGYADNDAGLRAKHGTDISLIDEVTQHCLCYVEVCDHAVFHGTDGNDVAGCTSDHFFCFVAHSQHFFCLYVDGYNGRLIDDDAFFTHINQCIGGTQVDTHIFGKHKFN